MIILGRVRLGSIRNKINWNNASKRLFGSYSHSGIPGFPFRSFYSQEQNSRNIFRNIFRNNPEYPKRTRPWCHGTYRSFAFSHSIQNEIACICQRPNTIRTSLESLSDVERVPVLLQPFPSISVNKAKKSSLHFLRAPEIFQVDTPFCEAVTVCRHRSHFFSDLLHELEKSSCIEHGESWIDPYFGGVVGS